MKDVYLDIYGRRWTASKLDTLLADPAVLWTVKLGFVQGANVRGGWNPGAVLAWARTQYGREEPAALLLLLVTRFFDLEVAAEQAGHAS